MNATSVRALTVNQSIKPFVGFSVGSIGAAVNNAKHRHNDNLLDGFYSRKLPPAQRRRQVTFDANKPLIADSSSELPEPAEHVDVYVRSLFTLLEKEIKNAEVYLNLGRRSVFRQPRRLYKLGFLVLGRVTDCILYLTQ